MVPESPGSGTLIFVLTHCKGPSCAAPYVLQVTQEVVHVIQLEASKVWDQAAPLCVYECVCCQETKSPQVCGPSFGQLHQLIAKCVKMCLTCRWPSCFWTASKLEWQMCKRPWLCMTDLPCRTCLS